MSPAYGVDDLSGLDELLASLLEEPFGSSSNSQVQALLQPDRWKDVSASDEVVVE